MKKTNTVSIALFLVISFSIVTCKAESVPRDEISRIAALEGASMVSYATTTSAALHALQGYRNEASRDITIDFFVDLTGSETVALSILKYCDKYSMQPELAFALAYEESRFKPSVYHRNAKSIDRGLFQLNSRSYPGITASKFYEADFNAKLGVSHLRDCMVEAGNEVSALAMYNAGNGRVGKDATPKATLDYISRIVKFKTNLEKLYAARLAGVKTKTPASILSATALIPVMDKNRTTE